MLELRFLKKIHSSSGITILDIDIKINDGEFIALY